MTESQAIAKAQEKAQRHGKEYLVINRPSHTGLYVIAKWEKHAWTDDETVVFDTSRPEAEMLDVMVDSDGSVHIHCDIHTAARLGGRTIFGKIPETQEALVEAVRDAWYDAGCP